MLVDEPEPEMGGREGEAAPDRGQRERLDEELRPGKGTLVELLTLVRH